MSNKLTGLDDDSLSLARAFAAQLQAAQVVKHKKRLHTSSRRTSLARWPMVSDFAGCMPNQVEEANANLRKMKIGARYLPDGSVEWSGPQAKREHLKSIGMHDRSGFY